MKLGWVGGRGPERWGTKNCDQNILYGIFNLKDKKKGKIKYFSGDSTLVTVFPELSSLHFSCPKVVSVEKSSPREKA